MRNTLLLIKYELYSRRKSMLIWIIAWTLMTVMFASLYESFKDLFAEDNPFGEFEDNPIFAQFGVDSDYFTTVENYFAGEFLVSFVLMAAIFAAYQGANIIAGKIEDKTIATYLTKDIKRHDIYASKVSSLIIFIAATTLIIGLICYLSFVVFTNQDKISIKFFVTSFSAAFLMQVLFMYIGLTIGVIFSKSKSIAFSISFLIFSWLLIALSKIDAFPDMLALVSPYYYIDFDQISESMSLDAAKVIYILLVLLILRALSWLIFRDKDIQV